MGLTKCEVDMRTGDPVCVCDPDAPNALCDPCPDCNDEKCLGYGRECVRGKCTCKVGLMERPDCDDCVEDPCAGHVCPGLFQCRSLFSDGSDVPVAECACPGLVYDLGGNCREPDTKVMPYYYGTEVLPTEKCNGHDNTLAMKIPAPGKTYINYDDGHRVFESIDVCKWVGPSIKACECDINEICLLEDPADETSATCACDAGYIRGLDGSCIKDPCRGEDGMTCFQHGLDCKVEYLQSDGPVDVCDDLYHPDMSSCKVPYRAVGKCTCQQGYVEDAAGFCVLAQKAASVCAVNEIYEGATCKPCAEGQLVDNLSNKCISPCAGGQAPETDYCFSPCTPGLCSPDEECRMVSVGRVGGPMGHLWHSIKPKPSWWPSVLGKKEPGSSEPPFRPYPGCFCPEGMKRDRDGKCLSSCSCEDAYGFAPKCKDCSLPQAP